MQVCGTGIGVLRERWHEFCSIDMASGCVTRFKASMIPNCGKRIDQIHRKSYFDGTFIGLWTLSILISLQSLSLLVRARIVRN